jgi:hypothetical protein
MDAIECKICYNTVKEFHLISAGCCADCKICTTCIKSLTADACPFCRTAFPWGKSAGISTQRQRETAFVGTPFAIDSFGREIRTTHPITEHYVGDMLVDWDRKCTEIDKATALINSKNAQITKMEAQLKVEWKAQADLFLEQARLKREIVALTRTATECLVVGVKAPIVGTNPTIVAIPPIPANITAKYTLVHGMYDARKICGGWFYDRNRDGTFSAKCGNKSFLSEISS